MPDPPHPDQPIDTHAIEELQRLQSEYANPQFVAQLIQLFFDNAPRRVESMREAIARGDAATCERVAHTLKSNAGMLGAAPMAGRCEQVERLAEHKDLTTASGLVDEIDTEFRRVRQALQRYL